MKLEGGVEAAGDVVMKDIESNPLTKEQFQMLEIIGFSTGKRKKRGRNQKEWTEYSEKKWEERLYVVCIPVGFCALRWYQPNIYSWISNPKYLAITLQPRACPIVSGVQHYFTLCV